MDIITLSPSLKLLLAILPIALGTYSFFRGKEKVGLALLFIGAFILRFVMISFDPYLHDWDERFHALVAKNMMDNPFVPMLRVHPVIPYDYKAWCCNHIWVHKQPLFMWQMALSMKLFGVNEVAMRLPSAILGALGTLLVYRVGMLWLKEKGVAYLAALFWALSYYQLELTSGREALDHNDLVYAFYVLASIWAYMEYRGNIHKPLKWLLLIGLFVGFAVLNKWLTGLLVFAGWGTMLLANTNERGSLRNWWHMGLALLVAVVVFLPWQIYTATKFPIETAWEQHFNFLHIITPLDEHVGDAWYHIRYMRTHYGIWLLPFLVLGGLMLLIKGWLKRPFTLEMLLMFGLIYLFFSQVATKMPAFTFVVAPISYIMIAYAIWQIARAILSLVALPRYVVLMAVAIPLLTMGFRPWSIVFYRTEGNADRNIKMHNTEIYKQVGAELPNDYVVFNCKSFEDTDMMFYTGQNAYHWWPEEHVLDSLLNEGHKLAMFKSHGNQVLPQSVIGNPRILVIDKNLW